jgi:protein gp37
VSVENKKRGLPRVDVLRDIPAAVRFLSIEPLLEDLGTLNLSQIHWAIIGGETGSSRRRLDTRRTHAILTQCKEQKVVAWVKELGRAPKVNGIGFDIRNEHGRRDFRGEDILAWPRRLKGLAVRRYPKPVR